MKKYYRVEIRNFLKLDMIRCEIKECYKLKKPKDTRKRLHDQPIDEYETYFDCREEAEKYKKEMTEKLVSRTI